MKKLFAVILSAIFALTGTFSLAALDGFVHDHTCGAEDGIAPAYVAPCNCSYGSIELISEGDNASEHYWYCTCCGAMASESHTGRDSCYESYCSVCGYAYDDVGHDTAGYLVSWEDAGEQHVLYCLNPWCDYVSEAEYCIADFSVSPRIAAEEYGMHSLYYPCQGCGNYVYGDSDQCEGANCYLCASVDW